MQTLRRQRKQQFEKILLEEKIYSTSQEDRERLLSKLLDAAESRTERKTDELQGGYDLLDGILKYSAPEQEKEKLATDAFESAFGITRPWDWYPSKTTAEKVWRDFRKYLVQLYEKDIYCFEKYATWSRQPYSRGAMTALGIKRNPQDFPDSWAAFCASEMYRPAAEKTEQEKGKGFYA